jgi:hypothetical protein
MNIKLLAEVREKGKGKREKVEYLAFTLKTKN